ncbi:G1 family glutamic endopeptidase [Bradyrhizobium betae]|uniref:G1 family glutamic endopeptidase n=1 Tax=Bradyrhizobium betae TaxID=244734 RepID=UPI003D67B2BB
MSENDSYGFYEVVPDGFNLLDATPDKLDLYGIPQRPDAVTEPRLFAFWKRLVSSPFTARQPTFSSIDPPSLGGPAQSLLNWSGALISSPSPERIVFATAGWKAPSVSLPSAPALFTPTNDPRSLLWIGLDGHNGALPNISLPQIGTAHWPNHEPQHFAWWEWWRNSSSDETPRMSQQAITMIANLPINAGDEILAGLAVQVSGDVLFFIKNQSTGEFRSFLARPPGVILPLGSSVEWVVERPTDPPSRKLFPLPNYGSVDFRYCLARAAADGPLAPGRLMTLNEKALMIHMREAFADPYRTVTVSSPALRQDPDGSVGVTCRFKEPT